MMSGSYFLTSQSGGLGKTMSLIRIYAIVYPLDRVAGILASYIALRDSRLGHVFDVYVVC